MQNKLIILFVSLTQLLASQSSDSISIPGKDQSIQKNTSDTIKRILTDHPDVHTIAVKIALDSFGSESDEYAYACLNLGKIHFKNKNYPDAEKWYQNALNILKSSIGKYHSDVTTIYYDMALLYRDMAFFSKAEEMHLEYKSSIKKTLGIKTTQYVECLNGLGLLYNDMQKFDKGESVYLEAKEIQDEILKEGHPHKANTLNNLAKLYKHQGAYEKAEPLYLEAINIRRNDPGMSHPIYATSLMIMATFYMEIGDYKKAEDYYIQAESNRRQNLGSLHPYYATTLENLGTLYLEIGNYQKAIYHYTTCNAIRQVSLSKNHRIYAVGLIKLADLYTSISNFNDAFPLYTEALNIRKKVLGHEHTQYLECLNKIGFLYQETGNFNTADSIFTNAIQIREKTLGRMNTLFAESLHNLAFIKQETGKLEEAESLYIQTSEVLKAVLGENHYRFAEALSNLAGFYLLNNDYKKAEPLFLKANKIWKTVLGKNNSLYTVGLDKLASLYENQLEYSKSEPIFKELFDLEQERLYKATSFLSENELAKYIKSFQKRKDKLGDYTLRRPMENDHRGKLSEIVFSNAIFTKGFLLSATSQLRRLASSSTEAANLLDELQTMHRQLATEYAKPKSEQKGTSNLEKQANQTEKKLRRLVVGYDEATSVVNWKDVSDVLKKDQAAIEFIHFRSNKENDTNDILYAAVLIRPGLKEPLFVSLFEEKSLDSLLNKTQERKADYVNDLYTLCDRGAQLVQEPRRSLYELVWKPIEKYLKDIKTIYFSPGGLLHLVNLDAIPVSETETLADNFELIQLNSTRQLVQSVSTESKNEHAILFGGIQFDSNMEFQNHQTSLNLTEKNALPQSVDVTSTGSVWKYLSGTEREIDALQKILSSAGYTVILKKGYEATEEEFKKISSIQSISPKIIHFATHGYFYDNPTKNHLSNVENNLTEPEFIKSEQSMLRSGLILAGGNQTWLGKKIPEEKEDGILTAYEISQMNLANTELVVLSACETGLGEIQGNEGVYGLQRAFKIAGAKYLIMSLWKVPDKQTSLLMTTFYQKWLVEKIPIHSAFQAAQKELRELGFDPYQWAGFVLVE